MDPNYSLGYWLRRQRLAHDLLQSELAKRIGIAPISLRKIEADERRPSPHVAERIAAALELDSVETRILLRVARAELARWFQTRRTTCR